MSTEGKSMIQECLDIFVSTFLDFMLNNNTAAGFKN